LFLVLAAELSAWKRCRRLTWYVKNPWNYQRYLSEWI